MDGEKVVEEHFLENTNDRLQGLANDICKEFAELFDGKLGSTNTVSFP